MKRLISVFCIIALCLVGLFYWVAEMDAATLKTNKSGKERVDDFILHIRVEGTDDGFKVLRSLQYVGKDPVEILHRTPLITVSIINKNHDYTGSPVSKVLERGNSYHPQDPAIFSSIDKGTYQLFCQARFKVNGEKMVINHVEELMLE